MNERLRDKVAIVTGAATGIGKVIARAVAREGAKVVVCGLAGEPVDEVVKALRRRGWAAVGFAGDVSREETAQACVARAIEAFGQLDILINNANGVDSNSADGQIMPSEVRGALLMTKYALPHLQRTRGSIVSTGAPKCMTAPGTEAWMHALMRGVAVEQAQHGIRANCVCVAPGEVAEALPAASDADEEMPPCEATRARRASARRIAEVYCFLASEEARFVSGALFVVEREARGMPTPGQRMERRFAA